MKDQSSSATTRKTFTDYLRLWFKWVLDPLGRFFNRLGLTPNMVTVIGMIGNCVGAYFLARGDMFTGGLWVLIMTPIDALDGTMARLRGEPGDFGAFVDSVSDRYSELIIYGGLLYYYLTVGEPLGGMLTFGAAAGSVLVSYVKARAEGLGYGAKVGLLTRVERYLVLAPSLVFNKLYLGLAIIAIFANITALQRIWHVRAQAHARMQTAKSEGKKP
ncbi:MAG TPA: CDP-alcohol phosphatidyltransferase family protein [Anaerolineales bacterium]|jgi:CDP-diacylglycerol--glycerol-3-phosphate 3-phosphatidyltransferase|nr:CDP-alcohol phosphatidyltransferase family protein [Anaerolineales bacterium]HQX18261.1 CDP-alcohol phosphatidyltransferase family protein [Anaerolineales bacterium]